MYMCSQEGNPEGGESEGESESESDAPAYAIHSTSSASLLDSWLPPCLASDVAPAPGLPSPGPPGARATGAHPELDEGILDRLQRAWSSAWQEELPGAPVAQARGEWLAGDRGSPYVTPAAYYRMYDHPRGKDGAERLHATVSTAYTTHSTETSVWDSDGNVPAWPEGGDPRESWSFFTGIRDMFGMEEQGEAGNPVQSPPLARPISYRQEPHGYVRQHDFYPQQRSANTGMEAATGRDPSHHLMQMHHHWVAMQQHWHAAQGAVRSGAPMSLPSVGSYLHSDTNTRACAVCWVEHRRPGSCAKGARCDRCHMSHPELPKRVRKRPEATTQYPM